MIRRPPRSTLSSSSAASDVYKRQSFYLRCNNTLSCFNKLCHYKSLLFICIYSLGTMHVLYTIEPRTSNHEPRFSIPKEVLERTHQPQPWRIPFHILCRKVFRWSENP